MAALIYSATQVLVSVQQHNCNFIVWLFKSSCVCWLLLVWSGHVSEFQNFFFFKWRVPPLCFCLAVLCLCGSSCVGVLKILFCHRQMDCHGKTIPAVISQPVKRTLHFKLFSFGTYFIFIFKGFLIL